MQNNSITILFLCVGNACRSQMAEAFARHFSLLRFKNLFVPYSAGTNPASQIPEEVITVMSEEGLSLAGQFPKTVSKLPIKQADVLVTMGCEVVCPAFPHLRLVEWSIPDPIGKSLGVYREVRDMIKEKVLALLQELHSSSPHSS
ncbi:MAG: arsenate reductase ArsC [Candidatus Sumerlaeia bacterium]|nr:arsenate reductase ArsC [Candidatus Sumerlaeia bacterium]